MNAGIVPIMPTNHAFTGLLRDFNPLSFEGNGFFFAKNDPYVIFSRIVGYLENTKFPDDHKILIKNVSQTFSS